MWQYPIIYDVIVIGGGHAGCEAALAAARMGVRTLLLTMNLDTLARMSCNPAIGGIAKGHMVREIDALGGLMGKAIDRTAIQFRMLNNTKGPAVWAPRAQADKDAYHCEVKHILEQTPNLEVQQGTVEELLVETGQVQGVLTKENVIYRAKTVILSSGTFMRGLLHVGDQQTSGGRAGDPSSEGLSGCLQRLGLRLGRLKTGTPPRIHGRSIDFSQTEEQKGQPGVKFSFDETGGPLLPQRSCYITYTTAETKKIIQDNLHKSPIYSGKIQSIGPRYCPSIEDKVVRFADRERHQIFLEPEGTTTEEFYANGISSALPFDVQFAFVRSIPALQNAEITRPAYAIEYDYIESGQIWASLECKTIKRLFLAGQINGTTGYEEAAAQGLMAAINAVNLLRGEEPFVLKRSEAYIGVMIDDLITSTIDEPYRMFTSRAEYRLLLRQDNADLRLRHYGHKAGLISNEQMQHVKHKKEVIAEEIERLSNSYKQINSKGYSLTQLLARPEMNYKQLLQECPELLQDHGEEINFQIEVHCKYAGYIQRQKAEIAKLANIENIRIPKGFDPSHIAGLRNEAKQKLLSLLPENLGQASRIAGISPADISVLMVAIENKKSN